MSEKCPLDHRDLLLDCAIKRKELINNFMYALSLGNVEYWN